MIQSTCENNCIDVSPSGLIANFKTVSVTSTGELVLDNRD